MRLRTLESLEEARQTLRERISDEEVYESPGVLIQDMVVDTKLLGEVGELMAESDYVLGEALEAEKVIRAQVYLEYADHPKYKAAKVGHFEALIEADLRVRDAAKQARRAKRQHALTKALVDQISKRSFALTNVTNLIRKTE